ncbi:MAG: transporter [Verrucomicrobiaceae bacterium]|nr:transporter [Verrucomicrobiaceae bacterium]
MHYIRKLILYQEPYIVAMLNSVATPSSFFTRKTILKIGAVVAVAAVVAIAFKVKSKPAPTEVAPSSLAVTATSTKTQQLLRTTTATGSFFPWQELIVGPEVGGYRVTDVRVDVGDKVRKGDELARLGTDMLNAERAAKRAALSKAQAQQAKARADFNRAKTLASSKLLSVADLDRAQSEMLSSAAETELAQANLDTAELRLRYAHIVAPADGVISERKVNIGQIAQVNEEMFRLLRDGRIEWRAEIPEALLVHIKKGQLVTIKLADGAALTGSVRVVAPTVNTSDRTAMIYVEIPNPGPARTGMFARGEFALGESDVQVVPLSSVVANDGYSYVYVVRKDSTVERRRIETGQIDGDLLEVRSGLAVGDKIVEAGAAFLKDGDHVRVVSSKTQGAVTSIKP